MSRDCGARFSTPSNRSALAVGRHTRRDLSHIGNRPPGIVSTQTSRGDTNMRKFILIAGFVLASAAAQAGDRSLSLGGDETQAAPAPAKATDTSKSAEAAEAPKYVERPAVVEPKAETSKPETSRAETGRTERAGPGAARMQRYANRPASAGAGRPSARESCDDVEGCGGAPHALRDPGAHHHGTASARDLLVSRTYTASCRQSAKRVFALCAGHPRLSSPRHPKNVDGRGKPGHDECG